MNDRQLSRDFWLREFGGWRRSTPRQVDRAERHVNLLLQPVRRHVGRPVFVTSWIREGSDTHGDGYSVDWWPEGYTWEDGLALVDWIATVHPASFGTVILEPPSPGEQTPHIHSTLPGFQNRVGQVLIQGRDDDGRAVPDAFSFGAADPVLVAAVVSVSLIVLAVLAEALRR